MTMVILYAYNKGAALKDGDHPGFKIRKWGRHPLVNFLHRQSVIQKCYFFERYPLMNSRESFVSLLYCSGNYSKFAP